MSIVTNKNKFAAQGITDLESLYNKGGITQTLDKLEDEGYKLYYIGDNKELLIINPDKRTALFSGIQFKTNSDVRLYYDNVEVGKTSSIIYSKNIDVTKIYVDGVLCAVPSESDIMQLSLNTNNQVQITWKQGGNHYIDLTFPILDDALFIAGTTDADFSRIEYNYNISNLNAPYFPIFYKYTNKICPKNIINLTKGTYKGNSQMTQLVFPSSLDDTLPDKIIVDYSWIGKITVNQSESYRYQFIACYDSNPNVSKIGLNNMYVILGEQTKISDKIDYYYIPNQVISNLVLLCPLSNFDNPDSFFGDKENTNNAQTNLYVKPEYLEVYQNKLSDRTYITVYPITEELKTTLGI